jgi:predicted component of type VI protein secretion system
MASTSYQLVMRSGPTPGKAYSLDKEEIFIGRDVNSDVVISDSEVSRKHARIILQAGGYTLEDLGSTNGTFVNGQRLMGPHLLRPGELIMLGENVSLTYEPGFDPDATMVSAPAPRGSADVFPQPPRRPSEAYIPPVQEAPLRHRRGRCRQPRRQPIPGKL